MKRACVASLCAFVLVYASPALALDCARASSSIEKLFCKTPALQKADEAMGSAYFKLLRETTDPDFHEALIRSQRRWLQVRAGGPDRFGQSDDKTDDRKVLLKMTRDRMTWLQGGEPIRVMQQERTITAKDSGGKFAGYKTSCSLMPPPYASWAYSCWGEAHRQHNDRVCSSSTEWASGHSTETRLVRVLKGGAPHVVATCTVDDLTMAERCPDPDDDAETKVASHWNTAPNPAEGLAAPPSDLWKYDPDIDPDVVGQPWMTECLSAPTYPPAAISRANSK